MIRWKNCEIIGIVCLKKCKVPNRQLNYGKVAKLVI